MKSAGLVLILLALLPAGGLRAQEAALDSVEARLASGRTDSARDILAGWWRRAASESEDEWREDRARALLLRARLAPTFEAARSDYLSIVLGHPSTPYAERALLRLGQGILARNRPERAVEYLERLVTDFPASPGLAVHQAWLARARRAAGMGESAVAEARNGAADSERLADSEPPADPILTQPPVERDPPTGEAGSGAEAPDAASFQYAVQTGAFRSESNARDLAARLREAGFRTRLVYVGSSDLLRVRVGRYGSVDEAMAVAERIEAAGFTAVPVNNVLREHSR